MSLSFQAKGITTIDVIDKVRALKRKIQFCVDYVAKEEVECYPVLNDFF